MNFIGFRSPPQLGDRLAAILDGLRGLTLIRKCGRDTF
jgi:hypothetical protein